MERSLQHRNLGSDVSSNTSFAQSLNTRCAYPVRSSGDRSILAVNPAEEELRPISRDRRAELRDLGSHSGADIGEIKPRSTWTAEADFEIGLSPKPRLAEDRCDQEERVRGDAQIGC